MSDSDSFINEVTEEVRRDRLYALARKWGWIPVLVILAAVGGATWLELDRAQRTAEAQAFGDALLSALDTADPETRIIGLEEVGVATPEAQMIVAFLLSGERAVAEDPDGAAAALRTAAEAPDLPRRYRDLALLRAEMLSPSDPDQARLVLTALAAPGAPYAGLAQEQLALLALRQGDRDGAIEMFRAIEDGASTTPGLGQRAAQMIVAIEAGATLIETRPDLDEALGDPAPEAEPDAPDTGPDAMDTAETDTDPDADDTDATADGDADETATDP